MIVVDPQDIIWLDDLKHSVTKGLVDILVGFPPVIETGLIPGMLFLNVEIQNIDVVKGWPENLLAEAVIVGIGHISI